MNKTLHWFFWCGKILSFAYRQQPSRRTSQNFVLMYKPVNLTPFANVNCRSPIVVALRSLCLVMFVVHFLPNCKDFLLGPDLVSQCISYLPAKESLGVSVAGIYGLHVVQHHLGGDYTCEAGGAKVVLSGMEGDLP